MSRYASQAAFPAVMHSCVASTNRDTTLPTCSDNTCIPGYRCHRT